MDSADGVSAEWTAADDERLDGIRKNLTRGRTMYEGRPELTDEFLLRALAARDAKHAALRDEVIEAVEMGAWAGGYTKMCNLASRIRAERDGEG